MGNDDNDVSKRWPRHLTATNVDGRVLLSWETPEGAIGVEIDGECPRGVMSGSGAWIGGLRNGVNYAFRVRALFPGGLWSDWCPNPVEVTPTAISEIN